MAYIKVKRWRAKVLSSVTGSAQQAERLALGFYQHRAAIGASGSRERWCNIGVLT